MSLSTQLKVEIRRDAEVTLYPFTEYFMGFEKVDAVKKIFGNRTEQVLNGLKIEFVGTRGYMGVSDDDGHLIIGARYLRNGDFVDLYLDIIHELVHVKQFREGKELFDSDYSYVERPTEVEAYRYAVAEARRLGLSDARICQYLKTEWMNIRDLRRLAKAVNVECVWSKKGSKEKG